MSVTLSSCSPTFVKAIFNGRNGAGPISVPGLQAGDTILVFANGNWASSFEGPSLAASDQISQTSGNDLSTITFTCLLARWS